MRNHCKNPEKRRWRQVEIKLTKLVNECGKEKSHNAECASRICWERTGNEVSDFGFIASTCETYKWRCQVGGQM